MERKASSRDQKVLDQIRGEIIRRLSKNEEIFSGNIVVKMLLSRIKKDKDFPFFSMEGTQSKL